MSNIATGSAERRQFGRRRTFLHGWIRLHGRPSVTCIVQDLSEGGAMLELPDNAWLPFRFHLTIESEGLETDCEVCHERENRIGVRFLKEAAAPVHGTHLATALETGSWGGRKGARTVRAV